MESIHEVMHACTRAFVALLLVIMIKMSGRNMNSQAQYEPLMLLKSGFFLRFNYEYLSFSAKLPFRSLSIETQD